jgi:DnaK suppressor protein
MTTTVQDRLELLGGILELQYQRYTDQLTELTMSRQHPDRDGLDEEAVVALTASTREALTETAAALRRMAEGTYGTCSRCATSIPGERLEILPHARFCVPCQRLQDG